MDHIILGSAYIYEGKSNDRTKAEEQTSYVNMHTLILTTSWYLSYAVIRI